MLPRVLAAIPLVLLAVASAWLVSCTADLASRTAPMTDDNPASYLSPTPVIDSDYLRIRQTAAALAAGAADDRERALRIHAFVRDRIKFGWQSAFYDVRASEVLEAGIGYCNTKSTLFIALLRAASIPARPHFVDLDARILTGLVNTRSDFVDHSYTEVWLGGRWVRVDSYIVDPPLFAAAQARLAAEGRPFGYGIHRHGTTDWDGRSDAFAQFVRDPPTPVPTRRDFGIYPDVLAFYRSADGVHNPRTGLFRVIAPFALPAASRAAESLRAEAPPTQTSLPPG